MDHDDIRHKLSEYLDNEVTSDEKAVIEAHLAACTECADALAELRKTIEHIRSVEEIEPPAWMTAKVMARVRQEAEKKPTLLHRFFFPLAVKLPVQTVAVLFLAVTAYYLYVNIEPREKYAEAPMESPVAGEAPAAGRPEPGRQMAGESPARRKDVGQTPGYRSLDMKYSYEKPAAPVPEVPPAAEKAAELPAGQPVPGKGELQAADESRHRARPRTAIAPLSQSAADQEMMAKQAEELPAGAAAPPAPAPVPAAGALRIEAGQKEDASSPTADVTDEDLPARKAVIDRFTDHDLPEHLKRNGLSFAARRYDPSLDQVQGMADRSQGKTGQCRNRYVVDVELDGIKQRYHYCYDNRQVELLGRYEQQDQTWTEMK